MELETDVLIVGGGTGGTAAALQAARRGARTTLVSEFPWLGGMLTSAGVSAPDGNELVAFQTGIWGAFLRELQHRHPEGLDHGWVSFFTYDPRIGAEIFADWVAELPNLQWIAGQVPLEVLKHGDRVTGVRFRDLTVRAKVTLDGTELGDLLALAEIPYRWGWEWQAEFAEPSAPITANALTDRYPVQAPTWVVIMQDFGSGKEAPPIPAPMNASPAQFEKAWKNYGGERFLNYGRLPGNRFMINWPIYGNDYGEGVQRLIESETARQAFLQESLWHSQSFAHFVQSTLGRRYGLAADIFPVSQPSDRTALPNLGGGAYALHPYFRESRRLKGMVTLREQDILPLPNGQVAQLSTDVRGQISAIAIGNYANDHHYPSGEINLQPKSVRWGGRWTGTPFTIPYDCLVPETTDGLLVCEKNISVSHITNGATRLQPVVLGIGQAAGMAAALCVERNCQPRELEVRSLQEALLSDKIAPAAVIPLFNLPTHHPEWLDWQQYYLSQPDAYPANGYSPLKTSGATKPSQLHLGATAQPSTKRISGSFSRCGHQDYKLTVHTPEFLKNQVFNLVTLASDIDQQLGNLTEAQFITVLAQPNLAGNWLRVEAIEPRT